MAALLWAFLSDDNCSCFQKGDNAPCIFPSESPSRIQREFQWASSNMARLRASASALLAGAIGLTLAARLSLSGFDVSVVARGESLKAIRENGVRLIDLGGDHSAKVTVGVAKDFGVQQILFLCPKSHDLGDLAMSLLPMIAAETVIVPVINGIPWWLFEGIGSGWWTGYRIGRSWRQDQINIASCTNYRNDCNDHRGAASPRPGTHPKSPSHDFG
jgi:Ketopantoate reductase PanE/ApbA